MENKIKGLFAANVDFIFMLFVIYSSPKKLNFFKFYAFENEL